MFYRSPKFCQLCFLSNDFHPEITFIYQVLCTVTFHRRSLDFFSIILLTDIRIKIRAWMINQFDGLPKLGLYSLSGKTSYRKISWSLEAARFGFKLFQLLWNLTSPSAAALPRYLSNFRAIRPLQHPISRLRDFTRFGGKTSYRLVNRGPAEVMAWMSNHIPYAIVDVMIYPSPNFRLSQLIK